MQLRRKGLGNWLLLFAMLSLSPKGVKALISEEGEVLESYQDVAGFDPILQRVSDLESQICYGPRSVAIGLGKRFYFSGKECRNGHIDIRYTDKSYCVSCHREKNLFWKRTNKDKIAKAAKRYSKENREKIYESNKRWAQSNPDKVAKKARRYHQSEKGKFQVRSQNKRRKAASKKATPSWLTPSERREMAEMYATRQRIEKETGRVFHVDHIVPLNGETFCGLHVPWNLQLLEAKRNLRKGNRLQKEHLQDSYS